MVIIGVAHSAFFARFVGTELKGELTFIVSVVTTASIVMSLGVHHAYPFYRKKANDLMAFISKYVSTCLLMFGFFLIFGFPIFFGLQFSFGFRYSILIFFLILLWCYNRVMGYVVLVEKPNTKNRAVLVFTILETALVVLLFYTAKSSFFLGIVCSIFVQILESLFYSFWLRKFYSFKRIDSDFLIRIICYGFLPMLALLMNTLNYRIDVMMLKGFSSKANSQIGIYSNGIALDEKVLLIPDALQEILLSKLAKDKGPEEVSLVCRLTFPLCLIVSGFIVVLGKPFIFLLYGPEYSGAYLVTAISVFGTAFMVFYKMISQYNIVNKKQRKNIVLLLIGVIVNVVLNCALVPFFGICGAAIATCLGFLSCSILFVFSFSKDCGISIRKIIFPIKNDFIIIKRLFSKNKDS